MTFGIVTISYRRTQILRLWLASIKRLREQLEIFIPVVVVGDAEHKDLVESYHCHHITQDNHPASRKWNTGVDYLMGQGVDYVVVSGSDDIFSTALMRNMIAKMEFGVDLVCLTEVWFYGGDGKFRGNLRKFVTTQPLGVGRCINRRIIEKVGKLWTKDRSWAMDGDCLKNMLPYIKTRTIADGMVVDVKNFESLNKITLWMSKIKDAEDPQKFYDILSDEEKQILDTL
jgi:glycosyltransferase involved in cell wall biosynthesis